MGCGASAGPKPITVEQITQMCKDCCVRMEIICVNKAFEKPEAIKVKPPDSVQEMRKNVTEMKEAAKKVQSGDDFKASGGEKAAPAVGGMLGAGLSALSSAADQVQNAAAGALGQGMSAGLEVLADALDKAVSGVEKPFETVGQDVIAEKKAEIINAYVACINGFTFTEPVKIIRGDAPWNAEQYAKVPGDAISNCLTSLAKADIIAKVTPVAEEAIKKHAVTSTWDGAIDKYNAAYDGISKYTDLEKQGIKKITFDLPKYIVEEIVNEIGKIMATEEKAVRADPKDKDKEKPHTFAKVFSSKPLDEQDFKEWSMMVQA